MAVAVSAMADSFPRSAGTPSMIRFNSSGSSCSSRPRRLPEPLNLSDVTLTYSIRKLSHKDGTPLVSPAQGLFRRVSSSNSNSDSAIVDYPTSPRTPRTPRTPSLRSDWSYRPAAFQIRPQSPCGIPARRYSMPSAEEQTHFERLCWARFRDNDDNTKVQLESILETSSPSARSCYNRILSTVRQQYHQEVTAHRQDTLRKVLQAAAPDLLLTKEERRAKVSSFLATYASKEVIGTHPFIKALYTTLYLQTIKESKGGGGGKCLEWALQDEVFMEAGAGPRYDITLQEQDEENPFFAPQQRNASSETHDLMSGNIGGSAGLLHGEVLEEGSIRRLRMDPRLSNPEILDLLAVFPSWVAQGRTSAYRFPIDTPHVMPRVLSDSDMEAGVTSDAYEKDSQERRIRISHGHLRMSPEDRDDGFEGTLVERLTGWIKRLFKSG